MDFKNIFQTWASALRSPKETFKNEKKNASYESGALNIILAGIISGAITGIAKAIETRSGGAFLGNLVMTPAIDLIVWAVLGFMIYLFAKFYKGSGGLEEQLYLISLYAAPMGIVTTIVALAPSIGGWLWVLIGFVSLYFLTLALMESHGFSAGRAVASWLTLVILIVLILVAMALAALSLFKALVGGIVPAGML